MPRKVEEVVAEPEMIQIEKAAFEEFLNSLADSIESQQFTMNQGLELLGQAVLAPEEEVGEEVGEAEAGGDEINLDAMSMDELLDIAETYGIVVSPRLRSEEQIRDFLYQELPKILEGEAGEEAGEGIVEEEVGGEEPVEEPLPPPVRRRAAPPAPAAKRPAPPAPTARRAAPPAPAGRAKPVPPAPAAVRSKLKAAVGRGRK